MEPSEIITLITSGDVSEIRRAACEIISFSQQREKVLPLVPFVNEIIRKTEHVDMGGIFAPNKRFVDYALAIIRFHDRSESCPCALYTEYSYECNDPNTEASTGNICINDTVLYENKWPDYYLCTCLKCGQKLKAEEREGHYMWWKWSKVESRPE